jgi:hypothetical protein
VPKRRRARPRLNHTFGLAKKIWVLEIFSIWKLKDKPSDKMASLVAKVPELAAGKCLIN